MVTYPMPDLRDRLRGFFAQAAARGLDADFHVDETMDPDVETLRDIAELVIETGFEGRVVVGHCCSLSVQEEARALDTLDLVAKAGIDVVSLPMCNLYLQDRHAGTPRTPRAVVSRWCTRCARAASASASPPTTRAIRSTPMATWTCSR
jgi:cytosine deaminase